MSAKNTALAKLTCTSSSLAGRFFSNCEDLNGGQTFNDVTVFKFNAAKITTNKVPNRF